MSGGIVLTGVRQNNLRGISLRLPKEKLIVVTGVSGSGKSSLVFDTIAAESQRQLNHTYDAFIRNRLPKHERPRAERLAGLTAAVVVDQKPVGGNARSTVGTMTEIHPMLRVLFSRRGEPSAGPATAYSFNDPRGMCPGCDGLGRKVEVDVDLLIDFDLSLARGALRPYPVGGYVWGLYTGCGLFDPDKPLRDYTREELDLLLHGDGRRIRRHGRTVDYEGVITRFNRVHLNRDVESLDDTAKKVVRERICPDCDGRRLNEAALASRIDGLNLADYCAMEIGDLIGVLEKLDDPVAQEALEAARRIEAVGLGYLTLARETPTLSGGEAQRLKTVRHLGSGLTGLTYIFDEPSAGLHPRDVRLFGELLLRLRDAGNTVLVVEHDPDVIALADHVVDLGPGAGEDGGRVVFQGTVEQLRRSGTPTGRALGRTRGVKEPVRRPSGWMRIDGAQTHNLKDVSLALPLGVLTAVTGVAGAGKSTLIMRELPARLPEVVVIDRSPLPASPRSTLATYLGVMDRLRRMFAAEHGVPPALFSANSDGACPVCKGRGEIKTDLAFMDPVRRVCDACDGSRYNPRALSYRLAGRTIAEVLALTAARAAREYGLSGLELLEELGLGHLTLGRSLNTLSGGERQRLKLVHRLHQTGRVYVFDEPTTGLHAADVDRLLALLDRLVDAGNTVIVAEHHLEVVKHADWVVDMGPEGGRRGGRVVFEGTPADLAQAPTHTGRHLAESLSGARPDAPAPPTAGG